MDVIKFLQGLPHQHNNGNGDFIVATNNYPIYYLCTKYFKPKVVLEIGSFVGYGLSAFLCGGYKTINQIHSVDSEAYLKNSNTLCRKNLEYTANSLGWNIKNNFFSYKSTSEISKTLDYDFIYVDGDHTYKGAMDDMELSWSLKPKVMIVDDYHHIDKVKKAVHEFARLYNLKFEVWDTMRGWALFSSRYIPKNIKNIKLI